MDGAGGVSGDDEGRGAIAEDGDELVHASLRLARAASRSFMSCSNFAMIF